MSEAQCHSTIRAFQISALSGSDWPLIWDKFGTFKDTISVHFIYLSPIFLPFWAYLTHFGPSLKCALASFTSLQTELSMCQSNHIECEELEL